MLKTIAITVVLFAVPAYAQQPQGMTPEQSRQFDAMIRGTTLAPGAAPLPGQPQRPMQQPAARGNQLDQWPSSTTNMLGGPDPTTQRR